MRVALGLLIAVACSGALAQEGRVLASVGVCKDSVAELPILLLRKLDRSAHERVGGPGLLWGSDYEDETGLATELHVPARIRRTQRDLAPVR